MSGGIEGLDAFLNNENVEKKEANTSSNESNSSNIENEFADLLNSFINSESTPEKIKQNDELDEFLSSATTEVDGESLDNLFTAPVQKNNEKTIISSSAQEKRLKQEEQDLARSISNFQDAVITMADKKNLKIPETDYNEEMLFPNYKPSIGKKLQHMF